MNFKDLLPKSLPFLKSKEDDQFFFALNIEAHSLEGALWGIVNNQLQIIRTKTSEYADESDLIEVANYCLDEALADFPVEPSQILFGVPDSWLLDENLKDEKLKLLKDLTNEIDLEPMAYVSTTHAIAHLVQKQSGVPLSSVLVNTSDPLTVSIIKGGKILGFKNQKRIKSLAEDIQQALLTFHEVEVLPSKILIYGSDKIEHQKDELSSFSWMSQLPFLHLPKVESLNSSTAMLATCYAGATEIAPDIIVSERSIQKEEQSKHLTNKLLAAGAVRGVDQQTPSRQDPYQEEIASEEFDEEYEEEPRGRNFSVEREHQFREPSKGGPLALVTDKLALFTEPLSGMFGSLPIGRSNPLFFIIPIVLIFLLLAAFLILPKANVTIFLDMRILDKESQIVADPNINEVDEPNNKIPGEIVTTTVSGTKSGSATGKKKIGDPAKGKIVIYNATGNSITLPSGKVLSTDDGKKFTINTSVSVASKSASAADPPSRSDPVDATAAVIGPEGNVAGGSDLSVEGYNKADLVAKVDSAFTGGVSQDVTIVTADDQKKLLASLSSELKSKAQEQLSTELDPTLKIIEQSFSETITKQTYSKAINDQASEFSLSMTGDYKGTAYNDEDLKKMVSKLIETNVPAGFEFDPTLTETSADVSRVEKDGRLVFLAKYRARLKPQLNEAELKEKISFRTFSEAEQILKQLENVFSVNIEMTPTLPAPLNRLPFLSQNINLEVTAK